MSPEVNVSFQIPKRCNEVIQVSEKCITTAYCTGKISENYKLSNTEHHGCTGSTMHYIHDVLGSSHCPETDWLLFSTLCLRFYSKITEWCVIQSFPTHCPWLIHTSRRYVPLFWATDSAFNPLNADLNPICCLLALLGAHHFLHVSRIRVKS